MAPNGNCSAYEKVMKPLAANASMSTKTTATTSRTMSATMTMSLSGESSSTSMTRMPTSSGPMNSTGMAAQMAAHFAPAAALVGAAALAFAL
jgi:hypothetical protein